MAPKRKMPMSRRNRKKQRLTVRRMQPMVNVPHAFRRMAPRQTIVGQAVYNPLTTAYGVQLSQLINSGEFTTLYDQYRFIKCTVKFFLRIDPAAQSASAASYPKLFWHRDYDDESAPATLDEIRENGKCKYRVMDPNKPVVVTFVPNVLQLVYASAIANTYKPAFKQWIDCNVPGAKHYGFKWGIDDLTNTNYRVDLETECIIECRNSR